MVLVHRRTSPPLHLRPFVDYFWSVRGAIESPQTEWLFADVRADLILDRKGSLGFGPAGEPIAVLAGAFARPGRVTYRGSLELLGIRFLPGAAAALTTIPGHALADIAMPARHVFAARIYGELERLLLEPGPVPGQSELSSWLENFAARSAPKVDRIGAEAMRCLAAGLSPGAAADRLDLSPRNLQRMFHNRFGLSPRDVAGIFRMGRAARLLRGGSSIAEAMLAAGYSDQAHGTRAFRKLTGLTPGQLRIECLPIMNGFIASA